MSIDEYYKKYTPSGPLGDANAERAHQELKAGDWVRLWIGHPLEPDGKLAQIEAIEPTKGYVTIKCLFDKTNSGTVLLRCPWEKVANGLAQETR